VLELTDFTPERSASPEKKALSVSRKMCCGFWWHLGSRAALSADWVTRDWALLGQGTGSSSPLL